MCVKIGSQKNGRMTTVVIKKNIIKSVTHKTWKVVGGRTKMSTLAELTEESCTPGGINQDSHTSFSLV